MSDQFLEYEIDNSASPARIKTIRGCSLPSGILFTPLDAPADNRGLSKEAIETMEAIIRWADSPDSGDEYT